MDNSFLANQIRAKYNLAFAKLFPFFVIKRRKIQVDRDQFVGISIHLGMRKKMIFYGAKAYRKSYLAWYFYVKDNLSTPSCHRQQNNFERKHDDKCMILIIIEVVWIEKQISFSNSSAKHIVRNCVEFVFIYRQLGTVDVAAQIW